MYRDLISQLAQSVLILCADSAEVERDTMRLIIEEEGECPNGSYEQVVEIVEECSMVSKLDVLTLWEQIAFGWVVGLQMGYDDFALYAPHKGLYNLSPIYSFDVDMDCEELPLTLNRKCKGLTRSDFESAMKRSGLRAKIINGVFSRFADALPKWHDTIDTSEFAEEFKTKYKEFLSARVRAVSPLES
ncbi:MAG: hypothetical protein SNI18_06595 [Rikenellaceae bacterium]